LLELKENSFFADCLAAGPWNKAKGGDDGEPKQLVLKVGAAVMLLSNIEISPDNDALMPLVNGSRGIVVGHKKAKECTDEWTADLKEMDRLIAAFRKDSEPQKDKGHDHLMRKHQYDHAKLLEKLQRLLRFRDQELIHRLGLEHGNRTAVDVNIALTEAERVDPTLDIMLPLVEFDGICKDGRRRKRKVVVLPWEFNHNVLGVGECRRLQIPLRLAWAITIHKSQGMSINSLKIKNINACRTTGQAYVALSRATSIKGLQLFEAIAVHDIQIDGTVRKFYQHHQRKGGGWKQTEQGHVQKQLGLEKTLHPFGHWNQTGDDDLVKVLNKGK
jgi:ATP-dependent exoDNAse (exonuclease V) alpha subunit